MRWHNIEGQGLLLQGSGKQSFTDIENLRCHFKTSFDMDEYQLRTHVMPEHFPPRTRRVGLGTLSIIASLK